LADTDEASSAAADEARRARQPVEGNVEELQAILQSLGYREDLRLLDGFKARFEEYRRLDDEILTLAIENTNVKAQRLSFGPAREAADAFRTSLAAVVHTHAAKDTCCAEALAASARTAVLEIQVMQAPHIAESEDAAMTRMEAQMTASAAVARKAIDELKGALTPAAGPQLAAAGAALDRFMAIHTEIITLSRRNSDVRSLALSLGRKRIVTAACDDQLRALEQALAKHEFTATR
jgi:negative regulator of replication initiation